MCINPRASWRAVPQPMTVQPAIPTALLVAVQRIQQLLGRARRNEYIDRQPHAGSPLDTIVQFGTRQAVESQGTIEM